MSAFCIYRRYSSMETSFALHSTSLQIASGPIPWRRVFWCAMSIEFVVGFKIAYPINWWSPTIWKHGMMKAKEAAG